MNLHFPKQKPVLRVMALGAAVVVLAAAGAPPDACAQAATASAELKLFSDSRIVMRDRISVEVIGKGPDIVMIPGLSSSRETWRRTAERLRTRHRVHLVQIAGFAGEPPRANASGPVFEPVLAQIDAYCATLGRPIVIGHSLGGTLGLALAERHPEHVATLLVVDSLPFYGVLVGGPNATAETVRPIAEGFGKQMKGLMPEPMARNMAAQMVSAPADLDRVVSWMMTSDPQVTGAIMVEDMLADLRPGLAALRTPTTVLYETSIKPMIQIGYAGSKAVTLVEVPDAKHFIMYDQPERFEREVDGFLARR